MGTHTSCQARMLWVEGLGAGRSRGTRFTAKWLVLDMAGREAFGRGLVNGFQAIDLPLTPLPWPKRHLPDLAGHDLFTSLVCRPYCSFETNLGRPLLEDLRKGSPDSAWL